MVEAITTNETPFIYVFNQNTHTHTVLNTADVMIKETEMDLAYMAFTIYSYSIIPLKVM